jgi:hypothetical protein
MGVLPNLFLRPIGPAVERMLERVRAQAPVEIRADLGGDAGPAARAAGVAP